MKRLALCLVITAVAAASWVSPTANAAPVWAPASSAAVHPGVQTYTDGGQCTANFIYTDGTNVYIGQAAHCASTGGNSATDGCTTESLPLNTDVVILGASKPGKLVYSSWLAMQAANEKNPDACAYNDLALVRIDPADVGSVNPSIPHWGGPVGLNTTGTQFGDTVYSYGNSILRAGVTLLSPKEGISYGDEGNGWTHLVNTATPGIPGDSGSAFLDSAGNALGDLSTIDLGTPYGVWNQVSDLSRELSYLHTHGFSSVQLVQGDVAFNGSQAPLDTTHPVTDPVGGLCNFIGC